MAYIHKPTPTNWYYCIDADDPILPSQVPDGLRCNWLSFNLENKPRAPKRRSEDFTDFEEVEFITGKWMLWPYEPDEVWPALLQATIEGKLGISLKAATPYNKTGNRLICVYTKDYRDKEDTDRVYDALRALSVGGSLSYKPDK